MSREVSTLSVDQSTLNVLEFCAGVGGLSLGVKLAIPSARTICTLEIEAACCEVLARRGEEGFLDEAPNWSNARTFDGRPWRGIVDLIAGGYPCQPFSIAGKQLGADDPRHLWPHIARVIREIQPTYCFFENVSNHLNLGFDAVARELQEMGYEVEAGLFSAEEVGAPHKRERLFILAYSNHAGLSQSRQQTKSENSFKRTPLGRIVTGGSETSLSPFPPGPSELPAWRNIISARPELTPALTRQESKAQSELRGLADGLAHWTERIRAGGNGVVPLVAGYALITLIASLANRLRNEYREERAA